MSYGYIYDQGSARSRRRRVFFRKIKKVFFTVVIFVFLPLIFVSFSAGNNKTSNIISPLADSVMGASAAVIKNIISPSRLEDVVKKSLKDLDGYGIAIKNLKTGESYYLNEKEKFWTASLYKLWVMATVYKKIEENKASLDQAIEKDIAFLNEKFDISSESAELTEGSFNMSIKNALNQMITISHNYAALSLVEEIGLSNISKFLKQYGFTSSSVKDPPTSTASDIALFFEKLYKGELAGPASTRQMLELLKEQQINDRIPKYLPSDIVVGHKTGELDNFKHDAGIVFTKKGDYIIVLLSQKDSPGRAIEKEAKLSKDVYEYFERR